MVQYYINHGLICLTLTASLTGLFPGWALAAGDEEGPQTLEEVTARIQELELQMIQAQSERYLKKHELEYGDKELIPEREKAKKLEKQVIELQQAYDMRLKVLDESIRKGESDISAKYREIKDMKLLDEAIQREMDFAGESSVTTNSELNVQLKFEQQQMQSQINMAVMDIQQLNSNVTARKLEVTAKDKEAKKLSSQLQEAEAEYARVSNELQSKINQKPDIVALDEPRIDVAKELQLMREKKKKLLSEQAP